MANAQSKFYFGLAILIFATHALAEQRYVGGAVTTDDAKPVKHVRVDVNAEAPSDFTTDSGKFRFPVPPLKVGFAYTFAVLDWVVIDPCVLWPGRAYLPDPDAEPLTIRVLKSQDKRLLDSKTLGCLVEGRFSRFASPPSAAERPQGAVQRREKQDAATLRLASPDEARLLRSSYRPTISGTEGSPRNISNGSEQDERYWSEIAKGLGFTEKELMSALDTWVATPTDDLYQKGLIALYTGSYSDAAQYIAASIDPAERSPSTRLVLLARAQFGLKRYDLAEFDLRKILAAHPDDELISENLRVVISLERPPEPPSHIQAIPQ